MTKKMVIALISLIFFTTTNTACADILISPSIINFLPGKLPRQDVVVVNQSNHNAYIDVTPYLVEHPGTNREKKIKIHNPKKLGLLVSPKKFIIPPKQHQTLRIMKLPSYLKQDRIYRITVAPIPNKLLPVDTKNIKGKNVGIRVVTAYGILAIARPNKMINKLIVKRNKKELTIENKGNTNILITGGKQCVRDKCFKLPARRMYAGNIWKIKLPFDKPINISTSYLDKKQNIKSN